MGTCFAVDHEATLSLPRPMPIGLCARGTPGPDYDVRLDIVDYSGDPHMIGRFVDVGAFPTTSSCSAPAGSPPATDAPRSSTA